MKWTGIFPLLKQAGLSWYDHRGPQVGAALAYSSAFSLSPLLLIAIGIAGIVRGEDAARSEVVQQIRERVHPTAANAVSEMLRSVQESDSGASMTVIGACMLLIGASGFFVQLQDALNTIWRVSAPSGYGIVAFIYHRILSFAAVLASGFFLLVLLITSSFLQAALARLWTPTFLPGSMHLWQWANLGVSIAITTLLFGLIFRLLPDVRIPWRDIWPGALVTSLLFTLGKYLIGFYLGRSSLASTYGAAGSLVVVLVWVYYSAQIVLFGAEVTFAWATMFGSRKKIISEPLS